jgi:hypothetical protein
MLIGNGAEAGLFQHWTELTPASFGGVMEGSARNPAQVVFLVYQSPVLSALCHSQWCNL